MFMQRGELAQAGLASPPPMKTRTPRRADRGSRRQVGLRMNAANGASFGLPL
jgi:hypothetical protein